METRKNTSPRCMVIGLDGVSHSILVDYMGKGYLPALSGILSEGFRLHQMDASIPDVSSTSWASFMTGANPGEHGIFGFMDLKPGTYSMYFPSSKDIKSPSIWDIIGSRANGKTSMLHERFRSRFPRPLRSAVLNIPQTYPALEMNGVLTSGFVCPDLRKGTYPESAYDYLSSIGYITDIDATKAALKPDDFFEEAFLSLEKRARAYEHFFREEPWDLFIGCITETDRVHHFFFDAAGDEGHKYHSAFVSLYRKIDEIIGRLFGLFREETGGSGLFLTMSDHGFTELREEVYVNTFLREKGFLSVNENRDYFEQVDAGTKAFSMEPARVYINLEAKYPRGSVKASERERVAAELKSSLETLTDGNGKSVIRAVYSKEDIYSGRCLEWAPDLVCLANDGFDLKSSLKKDKVFGRGRFTGMHTQYDAHALLPASILPERRLRIEDLAPIILGHLYS